MKDSQTEFQSRMLLGVSRTFALTIPLLPAPLDGAISNAYLLCRIADTIEDEPALDPAQKAAFHRRFVAAAKGDGDARTFAAELAPLLSEATLPLEIELVRETPRTLEITRGLNRPQQDAISRCVEIMCLGMPAFQRKASLAGLQDLAEVDRYCYFVAGVVGEMLTELFCEYSPAIARHRHAMAELAVSFGQGLQMTNILKDVWEDRRRGACWLPRDRFAANGCDLAAMDPASVDRAGFTRTMDQLLGVAHAHLRNALDYTLCIPPHEIGIRRFCLLAIGLALLTLKKIHRNPAFTAGGQVKITRRAVKGAVVANRLFAAQDHTLRLLFKLYSRGLPLDPMQPAPDRPDTWDGRGRPAGVLEMVGHDSAETPPRRW